MEPACFHVAPPLHPVSSFCLVSVPEQIKATSLGAADFSASVASLLARGYACVTFEEGLGVHLKRVKHLLQATEVESQQRIAGTGESQLHNATQSNIILYNIIEYNII